MEKEISISEEEYQMTYDDISAFNWCDRLCHRCFLDNKCKIALFEAESRKRHITNGGDPDDMSVVMKDVGEMFALTFQMLEKMAKELGIDLNNLPDVEEKESPPICELSRNYAVEVSELLEQIKTNNLLIKNLAKETGFYAQQISAKIHRIFAHPTDLDDELCKQPDYLTLLLIEKTAGNYITCLEKILTAYPEIIDLFPKEMNIKLMKMIYDHIQKVPQDARDFIEEKIYKNEAPSPFCIR